MKKITKLNSFWIRIIALITMTIDHIGVFLDFNKYYILRIIGRIAMPLFVFLVIQGALKTSNKKKYAIRLAIYSALTAIVLAIMTAIGGTLLTIALSGNIFIDLLLLILSVYILESDNKKIKPLIALPFLYMIFTYVTTRIEGCGCHGIFYWFPPALRSQYSLHSYFLGISLYSAIKFAPLYVKKYAPQETNNEEYIQGITNIFCFIAILFVTILLAVSNFLWAEQYKFMLDSVSSYSLLAGLFILFYSGKRGYNSKWFKVAYYLYYPVHVSIISLIFFLIGV